MGIFCGIGGCLFEYTHYSLYSLSEQGMQYSGSRNWLQYPWHAVLWLHCPYKDTEARVAATEHVIKLLLISVLGTGFADHKGSGMQKGNYSLCKQS